MDILKSRRKTITHAFMFTAIVDGVTSTGTAIIDSAIGFSAPISLIKGQDPVIYESLERLAYDRPKKGGRVTRGANEDYRLTPVRVSRKA